ncbi:AAA family ATPase [Anatilimnocola floriformis]|uniref:AAA family ATPase n=1 Tax=Anatilimnocola floriformis TaxID=2948575 RepID=UPI0020C4B4CB|nr:AAA family ATPase [Anatilimnocola floriformis]
MKIKEIDIEGFGAWTGLRLPDLSDEATVIYGPNEAGKTTVMQFVRSVLYGFSVARRQRYLPPVFGGKIGGRLKLGSNVGQFVVQRSAKMDDLPDERGHLTLVDAQGLPRDLSHLDALLAGVDEPTFNNVFAIGLREIQELAVLDDTAAADLLYKLSTGLDRVSIIDVMRELGASRDRLLSADDTASKIPSLMQERDTLRAEIADLSSASRRWAELAAERAMIAEEAGELERSIDGNDAASRLMEVALEIQQPWYVRVDLDRQIASMATVKALPEKAVERLELLKRKIIKGKKQLKRLAAKTEQLNKDLESIEVNRGLISAIPRIEALGEHSQWLVTLEGQITRLKEELKRLDQEIDGQLGGLAKNSGATNLDELPRDTVALLKRPSQQLREETEAVEKARVEAENTKRDVEQLTVQLEGVSRLRMADLNKSIQAAGNKVAILRKRIQVEERLDALGNRRSELEFEADEAHEYQETPMRVTMALGAIFSFGVMLVGFGVFNQYLLMWQDATQPNLTLIGFGLAFGAGSIFGKFLLERQGEDTAVDARRHLDATRNQVADLKQQRDELDAELPTGGGALDIRLREAENELRELERMAPQKTELEACSARNEVAQRRYAAAQESLKEARNRWKNALRSAGLPEDFQPHKVRAVAKSTDHLADSRRRREARKDELEQRERELLVFCSRVQQLMADVRVTPATDKPQMQIRQLSQALAAEKETLEMREGLVLKIRRLKKTKSKFQSGIRNAIRRRHSLFSVAGVVDAAGFKNAAADYAKLLDLRKQRDEISVKIKHQLHDEFAEETISGVFAREGRDLQQRWDERVAKAQDIRTKLAQMHERRGVINSEMQKLAGDRRLSEATLEVGMIEQQLRNSTRRWQQLAAISRILDSVRKAYETDRQPETLREASIYLGKITQGHYTRVWMPLDRRALLIEDHRHQSLPLEVLSRGTREAVYISLRLALAASFGRKGAKLPLVLDDVLVNFDAGRVRATAQVMYEFAKEGHQVILFTCHEHIQQICEEANFVARNLPNRGTTVEVIPAEPVRKKKKKELPKIEPKIELPPPPPPEPVEEPKRERIKIDPNELFDMASVEEQWFDPNNAWQLKKLPPPPPEPKVSYTDFWPIATAPAPSKPVFIAAPEPPPQPKVSGYQWGVNDLPDSWALAAPPAPLPPPPPTPSYEVYTYRQPEPVVVAPAPPPPPRPQAIEPRRPIVIVAPPPPPPAPLPPPAPILMEPIYVAPPPPPAPIVVAPVVVKQPKKVVSVEIKPEPRRRFTWESPEMYAD